MTVLVSRRAVFNILRGGNRCDWLSSTSVIARRAKPDVAIRFYLGRCVVLVRCKGTRIPTTSLRTGLGMTALVSRRVVSYPHLHLYAGGIFHFP